MTLCIATDEAIDMVFTLARTDFSICRTASNKALVMLPGRSDRLRGGACCVGVYPGGQANLRPPNR
jgi:hypothetical protein